MKKIISLFICLTLLAAILTCCSKDPAQQETTTEETTAEETTTAQTVAESVVTLGYYEGKSFNPFTTDSPTNRNLMSLVYDGLFAPDKGYTVEPLIAESYTNEGKMLTVTLDGEALFSGGSVITPEDVVYSFNLAKKSDFYGERLSGIASASANVSSVTFTLTREDIYIQNCLTFPIVKSGTGESAVPTGSGRYVLTKKNGDYYLKANPNSTHKEEMATKEISLVPITSDRGELYLLQTGDLTYFFDDMSSGEYVKISANTMRISLNQLVYLGINGSRSLMKDQNIKDAVSLCIDKRAVADSAYSSICRPSATVFNPNWEAAAPLNDSIPEPNTIKAQELLEKSGWKSSGNSYRYQNNSRLEMTLLVNSENTPRVKCAGIIAQALRSAGIYVRVEKLAYDDYKSALRAGEYDLYIGEIKLTPNMNLEPFFTEGGSASFGIDTKSATATAYFDFKSGSIDISTFAQVFEIEKPFIPLLYRDAVAYYSRELSYEDTVNEYDLFKNIYSWSTVK
ncbi:MAG: ABC transporter substrate-binding protein [Oscillospiraceae bacterium]|nr:ABC transporter substrate-binding protein [Oscillospiraceae bacterium]MDD6147131.1 ABC transporter substrate-binding protein [Oscillospiraceae bacterium]